MRKITVQILISYHQHLMNEEKAPATLEKYMRDVRAFSRWLSEKGFGKCEVLQYKAMLMERYAPSSVNSVLSSLNNFFLFCEWYELRVKTIKIQHRIFACDEKELTKVEYERLLLAAHRQKNERLCLLMQTVCSTGIRVSELRYITVEAVSRGRAEIQCKGKRRTVFLPQKLCRMLKQYIKVNQIKKGAVFITRNGKPLDRTNIWADMKKLCKVANVSEKKVFPHNLRHLFARTYYTMQKDIVRLADLLGHSSVNTTRIYTMENGEIHRQQIQRLGLLRC